MFQPNPFTVSPDSHMKRVKSKAMNQGLVMNNLNLGMVGRRQG